MRKALLIGAQTNGLTGVLHDVAAVRQVLDRRGFRIEELTGPAASRDGILEAYRKLIADARGDDAVVVYYSGHGGLLPPPDGGNPGLGAPPRPELQFIVPDDYDDSTDGDFRGITGVELSVLLARLTSITPNATVLLDCCHAAHMSRTSIRRIKSLLRGPAAPPRATYEGVRAHIAGLNGSFRDPVSNPYAVRLVACSPLQSAWEGPNRDGVQMGLFTDGLCRALEATEGMRVNWSTLVDVVRRDIQTFVLTQRPEAEGPSTRMPFETDQIEPLAALPVVVTGPGRIVLLGAPLLDVQVGDEFIVTPGAATATVDGLAPMAARAALRSARGQSGVPDGARAHRTRAAAPALPVRLPETGPGADLRQAMKPWPLIRPAEAGEETSIEVVAEAGGALVVRDGAGPLHRPHPATPEGMRQILGNLQRLAQATALRRIGADAAVRLDHRVVVEWGQVGAGGEETFPRTGALVHVDRAERLFFRLRNDGTDPVYVSLVDIGISSRVAVLTAADPGGYRLAAGATYTYGRDEHTGRLVGDEVVWPQGIDATYARPETVLVLVSDEPVDVGVLQQEGVRGAGRQQERLATGSPLERLLAQVATGATRDLEPEPRRHVRYDVQWIDFMVSPTAPPTPEEPSFLVDDRPAEPVRLLAWRGALPGRVAVRLAELVVDHNPAGIRVDAVVLTGGTGDRPAHWARTLRYHDGEPLDDALLYLGPAVDFLDLAIWVSRDRGDRTTLSDLLERELPDPAVLTAGATVGDLVLTAPHAAAAVAVSGAGAVVVNTAHRLLTGAVGRSTGLYRTSWLAQEQFGIGRHERHPRGFSFAVSVESVF
jgi:hypothetical protein